MTHHLYDVQYIQVWYALRYCSCQPSNKANYDCASNIYGAGQCNNLLPAWSIICHHLTMLLQTQLLDLTEFISQKGF